MGYTRYFETRKEIPLIKWNEEVIPGIKLIMETAQNPPFSVPIVGPLGEKDTFPVFMNSRIQFNGRGDDSYETVDIVRKPFAGLCKTNRKPYDAACVAVAIYMATCFKSYFSWSSGGNVEVGYQDEGLAILHAAFEYDKLDRRTLIKCLNSRIEVA